MEIVAATPSTNGVSPFHNHDVREWSRIDNLTGALERARLETDHWSASTTNTAHKYNKVVDSRARSDADGAVQQRARRQLEVFQSCVPGGRLQVIKTHTVSSSRWSSKAGVAGENKDIAQHFEDLELSLNPLDLSSQKSKASVGRSIGKRPPTRPHSRDEIQPSINAYNSSSRTSYSAAKNLHRVSRLCNQIHENTVKEAFTKHPPRPTTYERKSQDAVEILETEISKPSLSRTRSSSSEDINLLASINTKPNKSIEDLEDLEQLQNWRRASKVRRSLQFPKQTRPATLTKPLDLPKNTGSVRRIREDLETGRRLNTALRGNSVDLEALDQILQSISSSSGSDKNSVSDDKCEEPEKDVLVPNRKQKRGSFVTVESLQEVKGRLRRTSSPINDLYKKKNNQAKSDEDIDDGIVTEDNVLSDAKMPESNSPRQTRVRSYVYGMETMMNKKAMLGTGSLESRSSKQTGGVGAVRSEDWYNRRKSYGFEQVHNQQESINSITRTKTIIDSSTDSGICRSSEIVVVPVTKKGIHYSAKTDKEKPSDCNLNYEKSSDSIPLYAGSVKRYTSIFENKNDKGVFQHNTNDLNKSFDLSKKISKPLSNDFGGTAITVPISVQNNNLSLFLPNGGSSITDENFPMKRHSIAVDETKYVKQITDTKFSHANAVTNDVYLQDGLDDEYMNQNRKSKRVEFCKTEVHFAAESGKVNIVETDEKPPPTNNYRRRRRHSATLQLDGSEKADLPLIHFGDGVYEKNQFELPEKENSVIYGIPQAINTLEKDKLVNSTVTISTGAHRNYYSDEIEDDPNLDNETRKGILKNKPIKPKPYLLGDDNFFSNKNFDNLNNEVWGVKLKSVLDKQDTPTWKSTVTLKNTLYDKQPPVSNGTKPEEDVLQMELQKILQNINQNTKQSFEDFGKTPEKQNIIRIIHPPDDSSQSVSNVANQAEDIQKLESKGYLTKVNIGHGEAIVVKEDLNNKMLKNIWSKPENNKKDLSETISRNVESPILNSSSSIKHQRRPLSNNITTRSPVILRKNYEVKRHELKTAYNVEKLSSPSLVGQEQNVYTSEHNSQHLKQSKNDIKNLHEELCSSGNYKRTNKGSPFPVRQPSPTTVFETNSKQENIPKSPNTTVLRTPRKSEMTYFGVKVTPSPKLGRRLPKPDILNNKPDILQNTHMPTKKGLADTSTIPIYENLADIKVQKQFDSSILDELTKAADQILQAVNEYAEEVNSKENILKSHPNEKLDTISETKSWRHTSNKTTSSHSNKTQVKTKRTSSTSSLESTADQKKTLIAPKKIPDDEVRKKKNGSETSSTSKAAVKARRLQRASSREALLQSHGSSSEDLPISVPVRKPRLTKKAKSTNSTIMYETEMEKAPNSEVKRHEDKSKAAERVPIGALPEIRHKTAISTIRSTAEKSAMMRDRLQKSKHEEVKKTFTKRDAARTSSTAKTEKNRSISSKEPMNHRISTANIKKCHKSEASSR